MINKDRQKCLPVARDILDICVEDIQCTTTFPDALCIDELCQCQNQYHFEPEIKQCYFNKSKYILYSIFRTLLFPSLYIYFIDGVVLQNLVKFARIRMNVTKMKKMKIWHVKQWSAWKMCVYVLKITWEKTINV